MNVYEQKVRDSVARVQEEISKEEAVLQNLEERLQEINQNIESLRYCSGIISNQPTINILEDTLSKQSTHQESYERYIEHSKSQIIAKRKELSVIQKYCCPHESSEAVYGHRGRIQYKICNLCGGRI